MYRCCHYLPMAMLAVVVSGCGESQPVDRPANMKVALEIRKELEAGAGAASVAEKASVEPTGWATITGSFKVAGSAPSPTPLKIDKDQATCNAGANADSGKDILVGPGGGLGNVLVMLTDSNFRAGDPKWEHESYLAKKDAVLEQNPFDQKNCVFLTRVFPLRTTQTVPVLNSDNVGHNANIQASGNATPKNFSLSPGQRVDYLPGGEAQQPFQVTCTIHGWMKAWMISRNNPYFAVTAPDGSFKIENVPAAAGLKLEFRAWQERANFISDVKLNGQATKWNRSRFQVELKPGEATNLDVVVDASIFK